MDINKLSNHVNEQVNNAGSTEHAKSASKTSAADKDKNSFSDKVSLDNFSSKKSEQLFAKIELEKINRESFSKLKDYKGKLKEYEAAKSQSDEAAKDTEIGKMLNDPDVWSTIAQNIIDK
ncbi:MAG: hypothetical protein FH748_00640 [Balneolaceae bacterium]|nr:hypothetical protein [Balneolaceae bacterium]